MVKYEIEGGLNFYEELEKSCKENTSDDELVEMCLISNQPLVEPYITLSCNHKFNYVSLYQDIKCMKSNNHMEFRRLKANQIRCPYCRNKESRVLPYIRGLKCSKKDGVNWLDIPKNRSIKFLDYKNGTCCFSSECKDTSVLLSPDGLNHYCSEHYMDMFSKIITTKSPPVKKQNKPLICENVNTNNIIVQNTTCCAILKSGSRKGQECGAKSKTDFFCLRHAPKQ